MDRSQEDKMVLRIETDRMGIKSETIEFPVTESELVHASRFEVQRKRKRPLQCFLADLTGRQKDPILSLGQYCL